MRFIHMVHIAALLSSLLALPPMRAQESPSLAQEVTGWYGESISLKEQIAHADALLKGLDAAMDLYFSLPPESPEAETIIAMTRLRSQEDASAAREWLRSVDAGIQEKDPPLPDTELIRLRLERLGIFLEIFATIATRMGDEAQADQIIQLLALNLYLPHRQYPKEQQQAAYALLQVLARSFPGPSNFTWPAPRENFPQANQESWRLVVGPQAQRNLLNQIGHQRFRQVLQSLPPEALTWSVDYHGLPNALLERRLSLRVDHMRQRMVIEEISLNLRVQNSVGADPQEGN